jgi:hypothetical protein
LPQKKIPRWVHGEDNEILRYAQELFRQMLPSKRGPDSVSWDESIPLDRVVVEDPNRGPPI